MSKAELALAVVKRFLLNEVKDDAMFQYEAVIKYDYVRKVMDIIDRAECVAVLDEAGISDEDFDTIIGKPAPTSDTCGIKFEGVK